MKLIDSQLNANKWIILYVKIIKMYSKILLFKFYVWKNRDLYNWYNQIISKFLFKFNFLKN